MSELNLAIATGRRKNAIARVYVRAGSGKITCNGRDVGAYFQRAALEMVIRQPLETTQAASKYDIVARLCGGGLSGQARIAAWNLPRALSDGWQAPSDPETRRIPHARSAYGRA